MVSAVTLLPLPHSPTMPRISPSSRSKLTSSIAVISPALGPERGGEVRDLEQAQCWILKPRVEHVAQPVAEQVEAHAR